MSYTYTIYTDTGESKGEMKVDGSAFAIENVNQDLIHEYIVMYLANQRQATAHTKTRGEIQGSGRKLYRQKGTGNARVGDAASPIRRKGGVVFGPRSERNYKKDMNKKMRAKALASSIALKLDSGSCVGLDEYTSTEISTKNAKTVMSHVGLTKKTLFVLPESSDVVEKSFRNIPKVNVTNASLVNVYELMTHHTVVFVGDSFEKLTQRVSK